METTNRSGRMAATKKEQKRAQAKTLFLNGFALAAIAEITGVSPKTITAWRDKEHWEAEKELHHIRPSEIKKMILEYVRALKEGKTPQYKADDLSKIAAAFDRLNDSAKKAAYTMESFDEFSNYVLRIAGGESHAERKRLLATLQAVRPLFDIYIQSLLTESP